MNDATDNKRTFIVAGLVGVSLILLAAIYFSPIWWVALKAPNYPPEAFPDGIRIHFHMNGVFNGCQKMESDEVQVEEALDCVHEMDTINHYVGMYPIAAGGPVERGFSQFLMAFLAVMLIGFACTRPKVRMAIMSVGFGAIVVWMYLTLYGPNGIHLQNTGYIFAMVNSLDQDASDEEAGAGNVDAGQAFLARMKAELAASGIEVETSSDVQEEKPAEVDMDEKQRLIESIKVTYQQGKGGQVEHGEWNGSGAQLMAWHYDKSLGRYFNNPEEIVPMVETMKLAVNLIFACIIIAMVVLIIGVKLHKLFYWVLVLVPMALPVFFIIEYSAWLWWFGHSLNDMGAFTVKPFMPTVFGQGKVAQFSTHSYPYIGFFLMMAMSAVLLVAAVIRKRQMEDES